MFEWLSDNRATFALVTIIGLVAAFAWSIHVGLRQTRLRAKDEVFGDPERTRGGWYWAVCGVSALMLVWFYYSWGMARAVFPQAANELCQVAKIDESIAPISAALPISSRYLKSTTLVVRNSAQLDALADGMPVEILGRTEQAQMGEAIDRMQQLIAMLSDPGDVADGAVRELAVVEGQLLELSDRLASGHAGLAPTAEALSQPKWGTSEVEIPMLPMTPRGVLFDRISAELVPIADEFLAIRNLSPQAEALIGSTGDLIKTIKKAEPEKRLDEAALDVDIDTMTIVDQVPADGAVSLADGSVDMACIFGGASAKAAGEVGTPIMSTQEKSDAGIGSFDVVSVTESFARENPDLVRSFMEVTAEANAAWTGSDEQVKKVSADAGMDFATTKAQMSGFTFPTLR